jgi:hypothetical protein
MENRTKESRLENGEGVRSPSGRFLYLRLNRCLMTGVRVQEY